MKWVLSSEPVVNAQKLYDLREETGFTDGVTLHRFFEEQVGDPSPRGYVHVDRRAAQTFYRAEVAKRIAHGGRREDYQATI